MLVPKRELDLIAKVESEQDENVEQRSSMRTPNAGCSERTPVVVGEEDRFLVDAIVDWRRRAGDGRREFLVLWRGYPATEASWELEENLALARYLVETFLRQNNLPLFEADANCSLTPATSGVEMSETATKTKQSRKTSIVRGKQKKRAKKKSISERPPPIDAPQQRKHKQQHGVGSHTRAIFQRRCKVRNALDATATAASSRALANKTAMSESQQKRARRERFVRFFASAAQSPARIQKASSSVGQKKTLKAASSRAVEIKTVISELTEQQKGAQRAAAEEKMRRYFASYAKSPFRVRNQCNGKNASSSVVAKKKTTTKKLPPSSLQRCPLCPHSRGANSDEGCVSSSSSSPLFRDKLALSAHLKSEHGCRRSDVFERGGRLKVSFVLTYKIGVSREKLGSKQRVTTDAAQFAPIDAPSSAEIAQTVGQASSSDDNDCGQVQKMDTQKSTGADAMVDFCAIPAPNPPYFMQQQQPSMFANDDTMDEFEPPTTILAGVKHEVFDLDNNGAELFTFDFDAHRAICGGRRDADATIGEPSPAPNPCVVSVSSSMMHGGDSCSSSSESAQQRGSGNGFAATTNDDAAFMAEEHKYSVRLFAGDSSSFVSGGGGNVCRCNCVSEEFDNEDGDDEPVSHLLERVDVNAISVALKNSQGRLLNALLERARGAKASPLPSALDCSTKTPSSKHSRELLAAVSTTTTQPANQIRDDRMAPENNNLVSSSATTSAPRTVAATPATTARRREEPPTVIAKSEHALVVLSSDDDEDAGERRRSLRKKRRSPLLLPSSSSLSVRRQRLSGDSRRAVGESSSAHFAEEKQEPQQALTMSQTPQPQHRRRGRSRAGGGDGNENDGQQQQQFQQQQLLHYGAGGHFVDASAAGGGVCYASEVQQLQMRQEQQNRPPEEKGRGGVLSMGGALFSTSACAETIAFVRAFPLSSLFSPNTAHAFRPLNG